MFYEVTPWRAVGGASGSYEFESPWDTPAEFALACVSGNSNGTIIFSFDDLGDVSILLTTFNQGIITPGFRGLILRITADSPAIFPVDGFVPIEGRRIYISTSVDTAGKAIYITGRWRRAAPDNGSYAHSAANLAATVELGSTAKERQEMGEQWAINLAEDNSSALRQSSRPGHRSPIRRATASKSRTILDKLAGN